MKHSALLALRIFSILSLLILALSAAPASAATCVLPPPDLVGWYPGNGTPSDIIGGRDGTLQNGATFTTGEVGQAFSFDGVNSFVNIADASGLNTATTQLTAEAWINPQPSAYGSLGGWVFAHRDPFISEGFSIVVQTDGTLQVSVRTDQTSLFGAYLNSAPGVIAFGTLQHVAVTVNTTTAQVSAYVNGLPVGLTQVSGAAPFGNLWPATQAFIGQRQSSATYEGVNGGAHFAGAVDELSIYSRALSQAEIQSIVAARSGGKCPPSLPALAPVTGADPGFPATPYPYASTAITADPYPPTINQPVTLGAILQNPTAAAVTLTSVDFAISGYGLGLTWQPVGSVPSVTIPAATTANGTTVPGTVHPTISWTPPFSGHHCVQVTLHYADGHTQVVQRNLDILGISSGGPATASFQVGNPTTSQATISLKLVPVAQSPQGWTASLDQTSIALAPGGLANVNLTITPPAGAPSGSYATYNVEGYIGTTLIGGISKTVVIGGLPAPTATVSATATPGTFLLKGTALPYAHIHCVHAGGVVFDIVADGAGNWSALVTVAGGGSETVFVTQELGGTISPAIGGSAGLLVGVPPVGGFAVQGVPAGGATNSNILHFSGTGVPGDTVIVSSLDPVTQQTTQVGSVIVGLDGSWTLTSGPQPDCDPTLSAIQVDSVGNKSAPSAGYTITIDTRAPSITIGGVKQGGVYNTSLAPTITIVDLNGMGGTTHVSGLDPAKTSITLNGQPYTLGAAITQEGAYTLVVSAADKAGNTASQSVSFTIDTTPPVVSNVVANPDPVALNVAVTLSATVADAGKVPSGVVAAAYTLDGGTPVAMSAATGAFGGGTTPTTVTANLGPFTTAGVHNLCVAATDAAGNTSAVGSAQCTLLAVYDPSAGFVTGGGWISSPAGACQLSTACQGAVGRANFGFVSKYQTGATVPSGQTEFQFKDGGLNFHSTSYDWLVIAGAKAQYKGSGTINGGGTYQFILTAVDGDLLGAGQPDLFRIKIWDATSGAIVYDNQLGAADTADPTTAIGGGDIVIHKV